MSMFIHGPAFDFGKEPADTCTDPQHPDPRADFVMANPPFNMRNWKNGYVLTPGRYVGAAAREEDAEPFEGTMGRLTATPREPFAEGARLAAEIRQNVARLDYEL